jgi:predicted DsbA family dithiol-disulfide isomerase
MYPTDAAHTLLRHAHAKGTQPALAKAFFGAYFLQAKNIGDESLLAEIATAHGFSRNEAFELASSPDELALTREEAMSAAQGGIRGVPLFIFDGRLAVSGAQSVKVLEAAIRQALQQRRASEAPPAL